MLAKQKSLASNSAKKKKILLGTLIPVGCLVATTAIVVPVVLTQRGKNISFNTFWDLNKFIRQNIKDPREGIDFTTGNYVDNKGTDPMMLDWVARHIDSKTAILMHAYALSLWIETVDNLKAVPDIITINLHSYVFSTICKFYNQDASEIFDFQYTAHLAKTNNLNFSFSQNISMTDSKPFELPLTRDVTLLRMGSGNPVAGAGALGVLSTGDQKFDNILLPKNCWKNVIFPIF